MIGDCLFCLHVAEEPVTSVVRKTDSMSIRNYRWTLTLGVALLAVHLLCAQEDSESEPSSPPAAASSIPDGPDLAKAEKLYKDGLNRLGMKDHDGAIEKFTEGVTEDPNYIDAYFARGGVRFLIQDLDGALEDYDKTIQVTEKMINDNRRKGKVKRILDDPRGASQHIQIANEMTPGLAEAYFRRGNVKIFLDNMDGGCSDLTQSREMGYAPSIKTLKEFCGYEEKKEEKKEEKQTPRPTPKGGVKEAGTAKPAAPDKPAAPEKK